MILKNQSGNIVPLPRHDPIKPSTLKSILEQAGISQEQFFKEI
jgi:predicted RNA binding protein YcfA (HicA-like mRNA interferase family)